jgi:hypothetical protein
VPDGRGIALTRHLLQLLRLFRFLLATGFAWKGAVAFSRSGVATRPFPMFMGLTMLFGFSLPRDIQAGGRYDCEEGCDSQDSFHIEYSFCETEEA